MEILYWLPNTLSFIGAYRQSPRSAFKANIIDRFLQIGNVICENYSIVRVSYVVNCFSFYNNFFLIFVNEGERQYTACLTVWSTMISFDYLLFLFQYELPPGKGRHNSNSKNQLFGLAISLKFLSTSWMLCKVINLGN